ncbi:type II toxin-antitoxin system Phd/YefM family antitoxin [Spirochaeta isovalerica]|uniref:Antitoxin n=1 Tax=Spirochaeta isovalerica TaxID=150 RepID=A0A841RKF1_9SPIO|nr:type II toxin-antitoxin system Phd/YefM family antitoxin [Spirochaeta isovalerica]MBB6482742.1 prevent-host-death family protein [Spirochaeta isovalerica]
MNLKDDIKPISYIKTNAADMLKRVNETHNPIIITQNGEAKAVLLDTRTYQEMRNSLGFMKLLSESEKDIQNDKVFTQEDVFQDMENTFFKE